MNANFILDNDFQALNPQNLTQTFETYYQEAETAVKDDTGSPFRMKISRNSDILFDNNIKQFYEDTADEYKKLLKSAYYSSYTTTKRQINILNNFGFRSSFIKFYDVNLRY